MLRIFKFAGAFLGTLLIILLIVFGFNTDALVTLFENSEDLQEGQQWVEKTYSLKGLTEYIGAQPRHVSIASLSIENPDSSILYNEKEPRSMGRLSNLFLLIEYARMAEQGVIDPDEQITLSAVGRYQLPYIDASNHEDAIQVLQSKNKISGHRTVSLSDIVQAAVEYNDLAASDYLYHRIGSTRLRNLIGELELKHTDLPAPFCGLYILMKPSLYDMSSASRLESLEQLPYEKIHEQAEKAFVRLANDEAYRHKIRDLFNRDEGLGLPFKQLRDMLAVFPKTTALEMAGIMKKLQQDRLISPNISKRVKDILSWPMENSRLQKDFKNYGAIYDSRMGLVNGIDFGRSSYSGEPFAQAVLFDNLQVALWFHMSSNLIHQDFEQRLIWDPALRRATVNAISNSK